jgi:putative membrane protein
MAATALTAAASLTTVELPFHVHWDVVGLAAVLVIGYAYGISRLSERHAPIGEPAVSRQQMVLFSLGIASFLFVRTWPFHDIGESSLFTFHMIEHLTIALVVPPLLMLGTPWWLMRLLVRPILPVPVIGPIPDIPRLPPFRRMGYLFLQSLVPTIPASFMTLATAPIYPIYEELPRLWGFSVLNDQITAGLIMKFGGAFILWLAIGITFFQWAAEEERHAIGYVPNPSP